MCSKYLKHFSGAKALKRSSDRTGHTSANADAESDVVLLDGRGAFQLYILFATRVYFENK